jgi:putative transcriptional regulator
MPSIVTLAAAALAALVALAARPAQLPPLREPAARQAVAALAKGKLLISARRLPDPNFSGTVVLLVELNADGAVGLVLKRRSTVTLARVFPQLVPTVASASQAFLGGPVDATRPMALVHTPQPPPDTRHVVDGVHLPTAPSAIEAAVASGTPPARLRVYLGYSGWGPGQLQDETAQGAWLVLDGDAGIVFDANPATLWQRQIARTELIQARRGTRELVPAC